MALTSVSEFRRHLQAHPPRAFALALALFVIAFALRFALDAALPAGFPYLTFFPAIIIATYIAGTWAGVLTATLSFFAAWYFFIPPFMSFRVTGPSLVALAFFVFIVAVDILIIDRMVHAQKALESERARALAYASQRDEMFSELQHRVGNNLNMVSALLNMQARGLSDATARQALADASRRIGLIADINRMFHNPAQSEGAFDASFAGELVRKCLEAAGVASRVKASVDVTPHALSRDAFVPVALIVAECINNAIEHGIDLEGPGRISISGRREDDTYAIVIANDGRPLPPGFDAATSRSLGLTLVRSFARQLGGHFTIEGGDMTRSRLSFPAMPSQPGATPTTT